jgi:hypothetical protein
VVGDAGGPGRSATGLRAAYDTGARLWAGRAAEAAVTGTGPLVVDMLVLTAR